jgi:hypothetical protein
LAQGTLVLMLDFLCIEPGEEQGLEGYYHGLSNFVVILVRCPDSFSMHDD